MELRYGEEGNFSFPNMPPAADLIYEVELIGFDDIKEGKARSDTTAEERTETADRRKLDGNNYFKEEKLEEAMQQYEMAIACMGDDFMFQLFGKYRDMTLNMKNPCHLNMAACLIKLKRYENAIGQCNMVLSEDGKKCVYVNLILVVSLAVCKAGANAKKISMLKHATNIVGNKKLVLPVLSSNAINSGSHARNKLAMQEFMILPTGFSSFKKAMEMEVEV